MPIEANKKRWLVQETQNKIHVVPNKIQENDPIHSLDKYCWCDPSTDTESVNVLIHNDIN